MAGPERTGERAVANEVAADFQRYKDLRAIPHLTIDQLPELLAADEAARLAEAEREQQIGERLTLEEYRIFGSELFSLL